MAANLIQSNPARTQTHSGAGKYLTFILGRETYGIEVLKIREIIRMVDITLVPQMPNYIRGVINLRGKIIPVVDLRVKFGLSCAETAERTCIIVVQVDTADKSSMLMGLVVDQVEEVLNIANEEIEETPDFGAKLDTSYLLGMAKVKGKVASLLDIDRVLAAAALEKLTEAACIAEA